MAKTPQIFIEISADELIGKVTEYIENGWRYAQLCATTLPDGVEVVYTFSRDAEVENLVVNVENDATLPSITELAPAAFVFENESKELFGVNFEGISIDFGGKFYKLSVPTPMNPRSKAAIEFAKGKDGEIDE